MRPNAAGLLLLALLGISCAPKRAELGVEGPSFSATEILHRLESRQAEVQTLVGRGNLAFDSPERAGSAFFRLALRRPDSLLIRLQGPFGIDAGFFFLSPSRFILYNAMENTVTTGDPDSKRIRSLLPIDLTGRDLLQALAGGLPVHADFANMNAVRTDADLVYVKARCGLDSCEYWIDPDALLVVKHRRRGPTGEILAEWEVDEIRESNGIPLPRRIRLTFPVSSRSLSLYYVSLSANGDDPSFGYTIPPGARTLTR